MADRRFRWRGKALPFPGGWPFLLAVLVTVWAYRSVFTVPFQYDDSIYLNQVNARLAAEPGRIFTGEFWTNLNGRPLSQLSFLLNRAWWNMSLVSLHAVTLLLHLGCGLMVGLIARRSLAILQADDPGRGDRWMPALAAAVFLLHPIHSQAVIYISQRMEVLCAFWSLTGVYAYLCLRQRGRAEGWHPRLLGYAAAIAMAGLLATLSKHSGAGLPLTLAACEVMLFRPKRSPRYIAVVMGGLLGAAAVALLVLDPVLPRDTHLYSRWQYLMTQSRVAGIYLFKLFWPANQSLLYDLQASRTLGPVVAAAGGLHLALMAGALALRARWAICGLGILFFYSSLAVTSTILPLEDLVFEHRLYLPVAGFSRVVIGAARAAARRSPTGVLLASGVALSAAIGLTGRRIEVWQSPITLWQEAATRAPGHPEAWSNLGYIYSRMAKDEQALTCFEHALALKPDYADAWNNTGMIHTRRKRYAEAEFAFRRALGIRPGHYYANRNLGVVAFNLGQYDRALEHFLAAARVNGQDVKTQEMLGHTHKQLKMYDAALRNYRLALQFGSTDSQVYCSLAVCHASRGEPDQALAVLDQGLLQLPGNPDITDLRRRLKGARPSAPP